MVFFKKELLKIITLVIFSISLTFLGLELVFRIIYPVNFQFFINHSTKDWTDSDIFLSNQVARSSKTLGYEWVPNSKRGWMNINSLGMLDRERQKYKPKDIYRIICLGDSTTANSDYVRILEKLLNKNEGREKFEVWNCAVTGYNIIQYCRALEEKWLKYKPDMIIIGFCLNDFDTTPLAVRENNHVVGYFPRKEILPTVSPFLLKHSGLYRFIVMRLFFSKSYDYSKEIIKTGRYYLQEIKEVLSTKRIRFVIVILGLTERFEDCPLMWKSNYNQIKEIINDYNIESLDMVSIFQRSNPESLRLHDELHFNEKGSQIVAEAIYVYLKQNLKEEMISRQ
jgi:lysophospholipase L1-like esterase